ncbi:MAG: DUF1127 domain-containing protein [Microvirga sp.]
MTFANALAHLGPHGDHRPLAGAVLAYVMRWEAWLDRRAGRRALHAMTDEALADIGLSRADLGRY